MIATAGQVEACGENAGVLEDVASKTTPSGGRQPSIPIQGCLDPTWLGSHQAARGSSRTFGLKGVTWT